MKIIIKGVSDLSKFEISALNAKTILLEWRIEPSDTLLEHIIKFKSPLTLEGFFNQRM